MAKSGAIVAYIDCYYGITPGKLLAAILDLGASAEVIKREMGKLNLPFEMEIIKESGEGLKFTKIKLKSEAKLKPTNINKILNIINLSSLKPAIKKRITSVFNKIAIAESRVHKEPVDKVCLFEVGHPLSILTVTGIMAGIEELKIKEIYASALALGTGKVKCSHGILSVPTPATSELTKKIPVLQGRIKGELTTPLGAAIILVLARKFATFPSMFVEKVGRGCSGEDIRPLTVYLGRKI